MATFLIVLHVFTCVVLVLVVLVQSGKEGGIGIMGGGGSSQTVFGSSGGANFFTKFTSATAAVFMITSIFLTITRGGQRTSVFAAPSAATKKAPAAPGTTTPAPAQTTAPAAPTATPAPVAPDQKK